MPKLRTFVDDAPFNGSVAFDEVFIDDWSDAVSAVQGASAFPAFFGRGVQRRLFFMPNVVRPGAGVTTYAVDGELDWRDRIIVLIGYRVADVSNRRVFPGSSDDATIADGNWFVRFFGPGRVPGATANDDYAVLLSANMLMYADSVTGALKIDVRSGAGLAQSNWYGMLIASPPLGADSTPPAFNGVGPNDGDPVEPQWLNQPQDTGMLATVRGSITTPIPSVLPLGEGGGAPYLARSWTGRDGVLQSRRLTGAAIRHLAFQATATSSIIVDDSVDWRDRFLWGFGKRATADISPGSGGEANHRTATRWRYHVYTGPGQAIDGTSNPYSLVIGASVELQVGASDGKLYIVNSSGTTQFVTAFLHASFQLGPRSA